VFHFCCITVPWLTYPLTRHHTTLSKHFPRGPHISNLILMRYLCLKLLTLSMPCHPSTIELLRATNPVEFPTMWKTRDPYWSGRISTIDLLALPCSDLPYILEIIIISFFTKQAILIRRPTVLSLPRYWSLTWTSLVWLKLWHL